MEKFNKFLVFLIPIFLSLPDLSIDTGFINLRIDDILVYLFFLINLYNELKLKKNTFLKIQYFMYFYALLSLSYVLVEKPLQISSYNIIRYLGSFPYLIAFPYILQHPKYRNYLFKGAFFGGIIYLLSLGQNYNKILKQDMILKTSGVFKREVSFDTLNPNSVAGIALILGWINILNYAANTKKMTKLILGGLLLFVPMFIFARGYSIGTIVGVFFIILLQKKSFKHIFYYAFGLLVVFFIFSDFFNETLFTSAVDINVNTGKGFSGRYQLWQNGLELILQNPILGNGFTTEKFLYENYFDGHMSHQILLRNTIELGLINLTLFLIFIFGVLINRLKKYKKTHNLTYLIQFSILICFFVADMSAQLLYFGKYEYIIYSMVLFNINVKYKK